MKSRNIVNEGVYDGEILKYINPSLYLLQENAGKSYRGENVSPLKKGTRIAHVAGTSTSLSTKTTAQGPPTVTSRPSPKLVNMISIF